MSVPRPRTRDTVPKSLKIVPLVPTAWDVGQLDTKQPNQDENTDFKNNSQFLNYSKMLRVWNATEFVFLSDDCVGFKVSTQVYNGTVLITWQNEMFFTVQFRDMDLKIMGIPDAEEVLDAVKDYIEDGEVWV